MQEVLGKAPKPEAVWERQFDYFDDELAEMARMDWDEIPEKYLWYYFHDLAYADLQPDLFRHLFPACLRYWYETLMRNESTERGDSDFQYAIMRGNFVEKLLSDSEKVRLYNFFHDGFIDRIESQTKLRPKETTGEGALPEQHAWIRRFNTLGIIAPVIQRVWESWWALDHLGKAYCVVMYASGLIYMNGENPIYGAWTRDKGGGGPYLTETDAPIFDWAWREDNLGFLRDVLSADYIFHKLEQAAQMFQNPEDVKIAAQVKNDAKARKDIVATRINDLIEGLAKLALAKGRWS